MADFALPRESFEENIDYNVAVTEFERGKEQRRLLDPAMRGTVRIISPDLTREQAKSYRDHFISKYGALTEFTVLNPVDHQEYKVRYIERSMRIRHQGGYFKVNFELKVLP